MRAILCCLGLLLALPASANSLEASLCRVREQLPVARMEASEKLCRSFVRGLAWLPETAAEQARGMLSPESLQAMTLMTAAWMGSQGVPIVGQAVDAALLALGVTLLATQMGEVAEAVWAYANLARSARSERELDDAATHLSKAMATAGVNLVGFILTKRAISRMGAGPSATTGRLPAASEGTVAVATARVAQSSASSLVAADVVVMSTGSGNSFGASPKGGMANASQGPGQWVATNPSGSERSRLYQQQITGRPATQVYKVHGVEFDGFKQDVLLEAKGPGYSSFFESNGRPKYWFEGSKFKELMEQAKRQAQTARRLGLPLEWHIAEVEVAAGLREQFLQAGLDNIRVIHTPMFP